MAAKSTLQGLEVEDLGLLLLGLRAIHVVDEAKRLVKLEAKVRAALKAQGVSDVRPQQ